MIDKIKPEFVIYEEHMEINLLNLNFVRTSDLDLCVQSQDELLTTTRSST